MSDGYEETFFNDGSLKKTDKTGKTTIDYEDGLKVIYLLNHYTLTLIRRLFYLMVQILKNFLMEGLKRYILMVKQKIHINNNFLNKCLPLLLQKFILSYYHIINIIKFVTKINKFFLKSFK